MPGEKPGDSGWPSTQRLEKNASSTPLRGANENGSSTPLRGPPNALQGCKSSMSIEINNPEGCKRREKRHFLHPSGTPFIDIYQAGAQRTPGAVASTLLLYRCPHWKRSRLAAQRKGAKPAPPRAASRVTTLHGAHPLHDVHQVQQARLRALQGAGNACVGRPMASPQVYQFTARRVTYDGA